MRAVIYLPPGVDRAKWVPRCLEHCQRSGYKVVAVVTGDSWRDVFGMLAANQTDVVVVGRFEQLPAHREPRIEEATDYGTTPGQRRPRTLR